MATQQRFEGSSIEEVLGRVRAELGADAEIIEANKVRSGGLGGFFAKETYEVLAAPAARPAGVTPPGGPATTGSAPSLLDLAERVSVAETAVRSDAADDGPTEDLSPGRADEPARTPLEAVLASLSAAEDTSKPRSRAEQVAQQVMIERLRRADDPTDQPSHGDDLSDAFEPLRPGEMPRISTEGSAFNDVLQRIATDAGPEISDAITAALTPVGPLMAGRVTSASPAPPPLTGPAEPMATATPTPSPMPTMTAMPTAAPQAAPLQALIEEEELEEVVTEEVVTEELLEESAEDELEPSVHADAMPVVRRPVEDVSVSRTERLLSWLEHDHLPRTTLLSALRHLPHMDALPSSTGVVVAVVGERSRALRLCRQLARESEADPTSVVLASASYRGSSIPEDRRIVDLDEAASDRRGWRRRPRPTFVAVDSPAGLSAEAQAWTREVVAALDVHQVIGIVPAARKVEDVRAWTEAVGGVDGLALDRLGETTTPYAVLSLEIPVAYLDDEPATPGSWANVLMERTAA